MAGYSTRTLLEKLGLKANMRYFVKNPPAGFFETLGPLPDGVRVSREQRGTFDFIHAFFENAVDYERDLHDLRDALDPRGTLWISWRKGGTKARPPTDIGERLVRDRALPLGLVDVKVAAIDETWSGLKFVFRLRERPRFDRKAVK